LGGGFESMSISEVFGEFRTGKESGFQAQSKRQSIIMNKKKHSQTQIAHTLCVTAQMPGIGIAGLAIFESQNSRVICTTKSGIANEMKRAVFPSGIL